MNAQIMSSPAGSIVTPAQAETLRAYGDEIVLHLTGEQTGGACTEFTDVTPPGGGPPPHYHENEDELFHVLEGRASFYYEGKWTEVPPGTSVYMRKGIVHTFKNVGSTPLRQLIKTIPSGFEDFMRDSAAEFGKPAPPDMNRIVEIGARYGIYFVEG